MIYTSLSRVCRTLISHTSVKPYEEAGQQGRHGKGDVVWPYRTEGRSARPRPRPPIQLLSGDRECEAACQTTTGGQCVCVFV